MVACCELRPLHLATRIWIVTRKLDAEFLFLVPCQPVCCWILKNIAVKYTSLILDAFHSQISCVQKRDKKLNI